MTLCLAGVTAELLCVNIASSFPTRLQTHSYTPSCGRQKDRQTGIAKECGKNLKDPKEINRLLPVCVWRVRMDSHWQLRPQANNMEFKILAGIVIEQTSLITGLPGWPVIIMTYHWVEEHGVYNKILWHDKHRPEDTHTYTHRYIHTYIHAHTTILAAPKPGLFHVWTAQILPALCMCICGWGCCTPCVNELLCSTSAIHYIHCRQAKDDFFFVCFLARCGGIQTVCWHPVYSMRMWLCEKSCPTGELQK